MSDPYHGRDETPEGRSPPPSGSSAWAVTGIIVGVLLLLPGACSVFFIALGMVTGVGVLGLGIGALGIWMITAGISTLRRR